MLGVQGPCEEEPGRHARTLACVVAATVMAGATAGTFFGAPPS